MPTVTRKPRLIGRADKILGKTATAFVAVSGVGLVGEMQQAQAQIVYSGPVNLNVPSTTAGIYLNVQTGVSAITPGGAPGWDLNPWGSGSLFIYANNSASVNDGVVAGLGSSATLVDNLPLNTVVDGSQTFVRTGATESTGATAFVLNSNDNYIGFRFLNESTNTLNFGWARFGLSSTQAGQPRTLIEYAYDSSGASILVGQGVPEPTSLAFLSVGGLGLATYRRIRRLRA